MVTPGQDHESLGDVPRPSHLSQGPSLSSHHSLPAVCILPVCILPSSVCPASEPLHMLFPLPRMFWMYSLSGWYLYPLTLSLHLLREAVPDPHLK